MLTRVVFASLLTSASLAFAHIVPLSPSNMPAQSADVIGPLTVNTVVSDWLGFGNDPLPVWSTAYASAGYYGVRFSTEGGEFFGWVRVSFAGSGVVEGAYENVAGRAIPTGAFDVTPPDGCGSADFDCDGDPGTDLDIDAFFACLSGTCPPPPCLNNADFNGDGDPGTDADIEAFFRVLGGGAC